MKVLNQAGFYEARQRGSHIRAYHADGRKVTVPRYGTVSRGFLRKILRDAKISPREFLKRARV